MIQKCFNHARMKYARYKNTDMSFFRVKLAQRDKLNSIVGDITVISRLCRAQNASKVTAAQRSPVEHEVSASLSRAHSAHV